MKRITVALPVLMGLLVVVSCGMPEIGMERTLAPTATAAATAHVTETVLPASPTTVQAVSTPAPTQTAVEILSTPARTRAPVGTVPTPAEPQITFFQVLPAEAEPGDAVTMTWEAGGDRASICPSARFVLFTPDDCWQVPLSGGMTYTLPLETGGNRAVDFLLTVEAGSAEPLVWQASVAFKCDGTWFFSDQSQAGTCPLELIASHAAAQRFEHGTMIWIEQLGRYVVLEEAPVHEGDARKRVTYLQDPLEAIRDTSAGVAAPEGFYAPTDGFGLVWRGDAAGSPGYRERLGWALAPAFGYDTILQCDDVLPSGGRSWQTCYMQGPEGEVIILDPLERWYLWEEGTGG